MDETAWQQWLAELDRRTAAVLARRRAQQAGRPKREGVAPPRAGRPQVPDEAAARRRQRAAA